MNAPDDHFTLFAEDFRMKVIAEAESDPDGAFTEEVFTENVIDYLEEFGELDDASVCSYKKKGMKVNGYGISEDERILDLIVAHLEWRTPPPNVPRTTIDQAATSAKNFLQACFTGLHRKMEEANPAFDLASRLFDLKDELDRVRIFTITDGIASGEPIPEEFAGNIAISYHLWDMDRIYRCLTSGTSREEIVIDFEQLGGPLRCLKTEDGADLCTSYLAIVPGETLGSIYEKWGTRILEKNVRSFLQARGKINQGIRTSILEEPDMFLTYNNGISATASGIDARYIGTGNLAIFSVADFQIVNGGQTTASLFHAKRKDRADLSRIQVQMKLTVVNNANEIERIVPLISRYANTQNKINLADFAANDPFHREVEALSRTVWAPDPAGGKLLTRWFYERARGQYLDEKSRAGTPSRQRAFEGIHPRNQVFTKTDLAKYENTWNQLPYIVSRGAQKNFAEFSISLRSSQALRVDQRYFERLVAKAIIFKQAEKIVGAQQFGGYRANIVTYVISLISHLSGQRIDLQKIWEDQRISPALANDIQRLSYDVHNHITAPPDRQNITEWCKKEGCWTSLLDSHLAITPDLKLELLPVGQSFPGQYPDHGETSDGNLSDMAEVTEVKAIPASIWLEMSKWAKVTNNLEQWQRGILYSVGKRLQRGREPSWKQAKQAMVAYNLALKKGFRQGDER